MSLKIIDISLFGLVFRLSLSLSPKISQKVKSFVLFRFDSISDRSF